MTEKDGQRICMFPDGIGVEVDVNPARDVDVAVLTNDRCEAVVESITPKGTERDATDGTNKEGERASTDQ